MMIKVEEEDTIGSRLVGGGLGNIWHWKRRDASCRRQKKR